jgi:hypothetical protein
MTDSRNDRERISRRVVVTGTALALGAAAATVVPPAEAQEKMSQADAKISGYVEGRPALRRLHALPTAERVQGRRRRNQPERLVPAVRQEDLELLDRQSCAPKREPRHGLVAHRRSPGKQTQSQNCANAYLTRWCDDGVTLDRLRFRATKRYLRMKRPSRPGSGASHCRQVSSASLAVPSTST